MNPAIRSRRPIGETGTTWASGTRVPAVRDAIGGVWTRVLVFDADGARPTTRTRWVEANSPLMRDLFEGIGVQP